MGLLLYKGLLDWQPWSTHNPQLSQLRNTYISNFLLSNMKVFAVLAFFAVGAFATPVDLEFVERQAPDPNQIYIISAQTSGNGCPQGSVTTTISPDKSVVTFGFDSFQTYSKFRSDDLLASPFILNRNLPRVGGIGNRNATRSQSMYRNHSIKLCKCMKMQRLIIEYDLLTTKLSSRSRNSHSRSLQKLSDPSEPSL